MIVRADVLIHIVTQPSAGHRRIACDADQVLAAHHDVVAERDIRLCRSFHARTGPGHVSADDGVVIRGIIGASVAVAIETQDPATGSSSGSHHGNVVIHMDIIGKTFVVNPTGRVVTNISIEKVVVFVRAVDHGARHAKKMNPVMVEGIVGRVPIREVVEMVGVYIYVGIRVSYADSMIDAVDLIVVDVEIGGRPTAAIQAPTSIVHRVVVDADIVCAVELHAQGTRSALR